MISRRKLLCNGGLLITASGSQLFRPGMLRAASGSIFDHTVAPKSSGDEPTASVGAIEIDRIWQQASAAYNKPRAEILAAVDRQTSDGPFRPDWQSLSAYRAPD